MWFGCLVATPSWRLLNNAEQTSLRRIHYLDFICTLNFKERKPGEGARCRNPLRHLEKQYTEALKNRKSQKERLRHWVSFLTLCGLLERAVSEGIFDNYDRKGSVALALRFAEEARATKGTDVGVPSNERSKLGSTLLFCVWGKLWNRQYLLWFDKEWLPGGQPNLATSVAERVFHCPSAHLFALP